MSEGKEEGKKGRKDDMERECIYIWETEVYTRYKLMPFIIRTTTLLQKTLISFIITTTTTIHTHTH